MHLQEQLARGGFAPTEENIRRNALARVAEIYGKSIDAIEMRMSFTQDLKPSFVSDFRSNEYDRILDDIRDVADAQVLKEISEGNLTVSTVGDYCDHMVRCYARNPSEVAHLLKLPGVPSTSLWKRILEKLGLKSRHS